MYIPVFTTFIRFSTACLNSWAVKSGLTTTGYHWIISMLKPTVGKVSTSFPVYNLSMKVVEPEAWSFPTIIARATTGLLFMHPIIVYGCLKKAEEIDKGYFTMLYSDGSFDWYFLRTRLLPPWLPDHVFPPLGKGPVFSPAQKPAIFLLFLKRDKSVK